MFVFGTRLDYGLQIMLCLAKKEKNDYISLRDIANEEKLPLNYLAQIVTFKNNNLLVSKEGKGGGYKLAKNKEDIKVLEIIESLEGKVNLVKCLDKNDSCSRLFCKSAACQARFIFNIFMQDIRYYFKNITLADLLIVDKDSRFLNKTNFKKFLISKNE